MRGPKDKAARAGAGAPAGERAGKPWRKRRRAPQHLSSAERARHVKRYTNRAEWHLDLYHHLLTMPWFVLFALISTTYIAFNLMFAGLYLLQDGSIANAKPGSLADAFFFSIQTSATIGYGDMRPATLYANFLVTGEVLAGMTVLAIATGLVFARFSRPTARVLFSRVAVVVPHDGVPTLMFRVANQRRNQIVEAQVSVALMRNEITAEGVALRRFHDLHVERPRTPMFALSWTVMHRIGEGSPLHGVTAESLQRHQAEIVVAIVGIEETFSQTVNARYSYLADEILWNERFVDIIGLTDDGLHSIDYRRFHDTVAHQAATPHKVKA
jgi:inward rectifier potassium channel